MGIRDWFRPNVKKMEAKRNVVGLIEALKYKRDYQVQYDAAEALGRLGDRRAVVHLFPLLGNEYLAQSAARALAEIGDERAIAPLIGALKPDMHELNDVVKSLGKFGERAIDPLINVIKRKYAQRPAIAALGRIGGPRVVQFFTDILDADAGYAEDIAEALDNARARAIEPLLHALKHKYRSKREAAVDALIKIVNESDVEPLIAALKDERDDVRRSAITLLSKIGDTRALKPLVGALEDRNPVVQRAAKGALEKLGSAEASDALAVYRRKENERTKALEVRFSSKSLDELAQILAEIGEAFYEYDWPIDLFPRKKEAEIIGEQINNRGGFGLMKDVYDRVAQIAPKRAWVISRLWDGIGRWMY